MSAPVYRITLADCHCKDVDADGHDEGCLEGRLFTIADIEGAIAVAQAHWPKTAGAVGLAHLRDALSGFGRRALESPPSGRGET